jgi:hypothetical protein
MKENLIFTEEDFNILGLNGDAANPFELIVATPTENYCNLKAIVGKWDLRNKWYTDRKKLAGKFLKK